MSSSEEAYELLEESLTSKKAIQYFLAGYRVLYSTEDIWCAIQRVCNDYGDVKRIRSYITYCLKTWFEYFCIHDFRKHRGLEKEVFTVASKTLSSSSKIKKLFLEKIAVEDFPAVNIPPQTEAFTTLKEYHSKFTVKDFTDALNSMCGMLFRQISLSTTESQGMGVMFEFFDHIVYHVSSHILWGETIKSRAREISFFVKASQKLLIERNYEMAFAVYQGLIQISVKKLFRTWKKVPSSTKKILDNLDVFFDPKWGFENYRREIEVLDGFYVPILSILVRQLKNAAESNEGANLVRAVGKIFFPIARVQNQKVSPMNPEIRENILAPAFSVDKLSELVQLRENSDSEKSSDSSDYSDREQSPRPFGTPRENLKLDLSALPKKPPSPLRKSISFATLPSSPRPLSRSRIERTQKIRAIKEKYGFGKARPSDPSEWSANQVIGWLYEEKLDQYEDIFVEHDITGLKLLGLDFSETDMGIEKNEQKIILERIRKLKN